MRFANALYEYPKGAIKAFGYTLRLFNPEAQANLRLNLHDSTGAFMKVVNATGVGGSESLFNIGLPVGESGYGDDSSRG